MGVCQYVASCGTQYWRRHKKLGGSKPVVLRRCEERGKSAKSAGFLSNVVEGRGEAWRCAIDGKGLLSSPFSLSPFICCLRMCESVSPLAICTHGRRLLATSHLVLPPPLRSPPRRLVCQRLAFSFGYDLFTTLCLSMCSALSHLEERLRYQREGTYSTAGATAEQLC